MALVNCPECGKEVSDTAKVCVHCGFKIPKIKTEKEKANKKDMIISLSILFCLLIVGIIFVWSNKQHSVKTYYSEEYMGYLEDFVALLDEYSLDMNKNQLVDSQLQALSNKLEKSEDDFVRILGLNVGNTRLHIKINDYSITEVREAKEKYEAELKELKKIYK